MAKRVKNGHSTGAIAKAVESPAFVKWPETFWRSARFRFRRRNWPCYDFELEILEAEYNMVVGDNDVLDHQRREKAGTFRASGML